jgi:Bacterial regulatory proteins, tetR family
MTHSALVGARRLFMERGYAATPTEEIITFGASFLRRVTARVACHASRWVP